MIIFMLISWLLFGLAIGGMVAFFMEKWGHTNEHLVAATLGAVFGGVVGLILSGLAPGLAWQARGYSLTALISALIFSAAAVAIERSTHRRGKRLFRDARPDVP